MNKHITTIISIAVITGIIAFFGGMKYAQAKAAKNPMAARAMFTGGKQGGPGGFNRTGGAGAVIGSVMSKDDKSITVQIPGGGSKIVFLSAGTTVSKSAQGSLVDLTVGSQVVVMGTTNSDGSVTAESVQLRPVQAPKQ